MLELLKTQFLNLNKDFKELERNLYSYQNEIKKLQSEVTLDKCNEVELKELKVKIENLKRKINWEARSLSVLKSYLSKVKYTLDNYLNNNCEQNFLEYNRCLISYQRALNDYLKRR